MTTFNTVKKFGAANDGRKSSLLDAGNAQYRGQERVNAEIFTAMEILGRKLERSEAERDRSARRLSHLENMATLDEDTGKLYLPAVLEDAPKKSASVTPKWMPVAIALNIIFAFLALGISLMSTMRPVQIAATTPAPQVVASVAPVETVFKKSEEAVKPAEEETPAPVVAQEEPAQPPAEEDLAAAEVPAPAPVAVAAPVAPTPVPVVIAADGVKPDADLPKSLVALEQRAFQGVPEAQHDLATLYAAGKNGAPLDYGRAQYWFKKAAARGIANASYNIGVMYQQGLGGDIDMKQAIKWYEKAADAGHPEAMYNLGIAYVQGVGTKADIAKGVSYFKRAANAGIAQAAYNLGVLYESNYIGPIDTKKAMEWYNVAAREGHADAKEAVARINAASDVGKIEPAAGN